tara:strand:- start:2504 stop:2773 length:270 start_codon:yes stop_codon:yes gene_type:complete
MKKVETVDLKPKAEKVPEKNLVELRSAVNTLNGLQFEIGNIETQKHQALHQFASAQDNITLLQSALEKEYGTYDINLQDGTINYPKDAE